jgi:hypothetical protein
MDQAYEANSLPENYEIKLPIRVGLLIGFVGSLGIMVVVATILVLNGRDIFEAARLIATVVYGPDAAEGAAPILIGTVVHLATGAIFGAIFACLMPCLPRGFMIVAALMYALGVWLMSSFVILPIVAPPMIAADANKSILLIAHVVYGIVLGAAGGTYQLLWRLPSAWQPSDPQ